jgi:hypothetical protein
MRWLCGRVIKNALATLASGQRSVVSAISVEGCRTGDAAASLGMSKIAVRVALHRGQKVRTRSRCDPVHIHNKRSASLQFNREI